ncbi:MAG: copper resistance protein CopC [Actinomycetota bacterium]
MSVRRLFLAVIVAAVVSVAVGPPAPAHTAMLRASPDRDAVAGGAIAYVDLEFLEPVSEAEVQVTYNGVPVAGRTTVSEGELITFALTEPLTQPGRYQVGYQMISFDTDFTTGGYFFTFDPAAGQAGRLELSESGGIFDNTLVLSAGGMVVVAALLALFVWRTDNRRRREYLAAIEDQSSGEYEW